MGGVPKWTGWIAEKPGENNRWPGYHRWFWRRVVPWEVRFWLVFAGFLVLLAVVLLTVVLLQAA